MGQRIVIFIGEGGDIVQVDAADGCIVFGLFRILKFEQSPVFKPGDDALKRNRFSVIITLDTRASDFP